MRPSQRLLSIAPLARFATDTRPVATPSAPSCLFAFMVVVPIVLRRIAPKAVVGASIDSWMCAQLAWLAAMTVAGPVIDFCSVRLWWSPGFGVIRLPCSAGAVTPTVVICLGVVIVLLYPIAEEIFWRGYLLEQLRNFAGSAVAVLADSILFSLAHLVAVGPVHGIATFGLACLGCVAARFNISFR